MGIKQERRDTHRQHGDPEVDNPPGEESERHIQQHHQCPHSQINTWPSKSGIENAEG